jgi:hypothetical protein
MDAEAAGGEALDLCGNTGAEIRGVKSPDRLYTGFP